MVTNYLGWWSRELESLTQSLNRSLEIWSIAQFENFVAPFKSFDLIITFVLRNFFFKQISITHLEIIKLEALTCTSNNCKTSDIRSFEKKKKLVQFFQKLIPTASTSALSASKRPPSSSSTSPAMACEPREDGIISRSCSRHAIHAAPPRLSDPPPDPFAYCAPIEYARHTALRVGARF